MCAWDVPRETLERFMMADPKTSPLFTELELSILRAGLNMRIASLDRVSKTYPTGSSLHLAVREDIQAVKALIAKLDRI